MITIDAAVSGNVDQSHFAMVPSQHFTFSPDLDKPAAYMGQDWAVLEPDPYMADGGSYRSRRYGLFQLTGATGQLTYIPDASFYQSVEINPLNGGEHRQFSSLGADTIKNPFLRELILFDFAQLTLHKKTQGNWLIGVHQIRITSKEGMSGNPTPEGTHRDDENYTSQHLISRHNISGGINYFYGNGIKPTTAPEATWKQTSYFDSYYFDRSQWHSVSPIVSGKLEGEGYRDVLLLDFTESSRVAGMV